MLIVRTIKGQSRSSPSLEREAAAFVSQQATESAEKYQAVWMEPEGRSLLGKWRKSPGVAGARRILYFKWKGEDNRRKRLPDRHAEQDMEYTKR
mgnify:CR=1